MVRRQLLLPRRFYTTKVQQRRFCNVRSMSALALNSGHKSGIAESVAKVVVARLQRHHPHPEHCLVADIDIVLARECQLAVIANTEHRQACGYWLYRIAVPDIHR
jgi:hypothetical protein